MAARQDLEAGVDADWLDLHPVDCDTCRLSRGAMEEAGLSYRSWAPVAAVPLLFRETMAQAAETVGADWSDVGRGGGHSIRRHMARDVVLIGALTLVLLFVALAAKTHEAPITNAVPTAEDTSASAAKEVVRKKKHRARRAHRAKKSAAPALVADESGEPTLLSSSGSNGTSGVAPQEPSRRVRLDRDSQKGGGREQVDMVPTPGTETPLPEPQPQPEPQPEPQPQPQPPPKPPPCITRVCQPGPD